MKDAYKGKKKKKKIFTSFHFFVAEVIVVAGPFTSCMMHTNPRRPQLIENMY